MSPSALLPQDVVVLAKLLNYPDRRSFLARKAADLFIRILTECCRLLGDDAAGKGTRALTKRSGHAGPLQEKGMECRGVRSSRTTPQPASRLFQLQHAGRAR